MLDQSIKGETYTLKLKTKHMSHPDKMPCPTFDLSVERSGCAARCLYGIKQICYDVVNFNTNAWNILRTNILNRNWDLLESVEFNSVLQNELLSDGNKWFRFFSAGDFPNIESMHKIMDVCRSIDIDVKKFWIPTSREDILVTYLENGNTIPDNVCVRFSSPVIGDPSLPQLPYITELFEKHGICYSATTLNVAEANCAASITHGQCGKCRDCWDKTHKLTIYLMHNPVAIKRAIKHLKDLLHFGDGAVVP